MQPAYRFGSFAAWPLARGKGILPLFGTTTYGRLSFASPVLGSR